jgi:hypothetical protein
MTIIQKAGNKGVCEVAERFEYICMLIGVHNCADALVNTWLFLKMLSKQGPMTK